MNHNTTAVSNQDVRRLDRKYVFHSWLVKGGINPLVSAGAESCELWDCDDKYHLDFSSRQTKNRSLP